MATLCRTTIPPFVTSARGRAAPNFRNQPQTGIMDVMNLSHIRALIFDLDGTLIDSQQDLINTTNATLRELGRSELPAATVSSFIGHGAAKLVSRALGAGATEREQADALEIFLRHYEANKLDYTVAYPGVPEALEKLSPTPMAVLTN